VKSVIALASIGVVPGSSDYLVAPNCTAKPAPRNSVSTLALPRNRHFPPCKTLLHMQQKFVGPGSWPRGDIGKSRWLPMNLPLVTADVRRRSLWECNDFRLVPSAATGFRGSTRESSVRGILTPAISLGESVRGRRKAEIGSRETESAVGKVWSSAFTRPGAPEDGTPNGRFIGRQTPPRTVKGSNATWSSPRLRFLLPEPPANRNRTHSRAPDNDAQSPGGAGGPPRPRPSGARVDLCWAPFKSLFFACFNCRT
jgi:hypothetical protein